MPPTPSRTNLLSIAAGAMLGLVTLIYLIAYEPWLGGPAHPLGGDYSYFLPRLLGNHFWFRLNGWFAVPWFTPAFCGGMPEWANPQSMPYSLPQWLLFFADPVTTVRITFAACAVVAASGTWVLLRRGFGTSPEAALLGAAVFLFNGFFICRMIMGHFAFHTFVLAPWVAWLVAAPTTSRAQATLRTLIAGVLLAIMIQGGAVAILPPVVLAWVAIGWLRAAPGFWLRLGGMLLVGALLCAGRLSAMAALATQFPRDHYPLSGFRSVGGLLQTAFESLFLQGRGSDGSELIDSVVQPSAQERQFSVSPVPLLLIVAALIRLRPRVTRRGVGLALLLTIPLLLNLYLPGWTPFLKQLPVIKSNLTLVRWFVAYIPLLAVFSALAVDKLPWRLPIVALGLIGIIGWSLATDRSQYDDKPYKPDTIVNAWRAVRDGQPVPSIGAMDVQFQPDGRPYYLIGGDDIVAVGGSQVFCYEPLFGYALEKLPWRPLHAGSPFDVTDGHLNVKNPACELYPVENQCRPGDQFLTSQEDSAQAFLSWSPFPFKTPPRQKIANALSAVSVGIVPAAILFLLWRTRKKNQGAGESARAASN